MSFYSALIKTTIPPKTFQLRISRSFRPIALPMNCRPN